MRLLRPRRQAGRELAALLGGRPRNWEGLLAAALPRGGVVGVRAGGEELILPLGVPVTARFEVASVTKPFTAALFAVLAQEGGPDWDEALRRLGPPFARLPPGLTARRLATHTAGLPREPLRAALLAPLRPHDPFGRLDERAVLASAARWGRAPGGNFVYSNLGYGLLALAAAHRAGQAYPAALRSRVLEPLGLDCRFGPALGDARPHSWLHGSAYTGFGGLTGAGGLFASAPELLRFAAAHPAGELPTPWRELAHPRGLSGGVIGGGVGVAPGWFGRGALRWHEGTAHGTRSALGFDGGSGAAAVVLSRAGPGPLQPFLPRSPALGLLLALLTGE